MLKHKMHTIILRVHQFKTIPFQKEFFHWKLNQKKNDKAQTDYQSSSKFDYKVCSL